MENELLKLILQELTEQKEEFKEFKEEFKELKEEVKETNKRLTSLEEKVDINTENIKMLKDIVMTHYKEFKDFVKYNNLQHNIYDANLLREDEEEYNQDEANSQSE